MLPLIRLKMLPVCNINHESDKWITYNDKDFEKNKFLNSRVTTPTALVKFQKAAYMLFYQRRENVSSTSDSESNHGGPQSDEDDRFSLNNDSEHNGDNFNDPNESSESSQSPRENTNEQNNATRPLNDNTNPNASTSSSQSAEENTNGHNNDSPSPQMCPTQGRQVPVIDLSNDVDVSDDEEDDAEVADKVETNRNDICPICWQTIESERDRACIDTDEKCVCGDLQYHSFCVRRHRNVCRDQNIPWKCGRHQNEIHRIMNMDGENIFENDENDVDICIICRDSLDTKSTWGRFLCSTCPYWYHNDCHVNNKGSYHMDSCTGQYTRLKCAMCRKSPRSIEML